MWCSNAHILIYLCSENNKTFKLNVSRTRQDHDVEEQTKKQWKSMLPFQNNHHWKNNNLENFYSSFQHFIERLIKTALDGGFYQSFAWTVEKKSRT